MEGSQNEYEESSEWFVKYLNRQGDWLEKTRGNLMVAATVIAGMSFQVMVSPPGGVWENDNCPSGTSPVFFAPFLMNTSAKSRQRRPFPTSRSYGSHPQMVLSVTFLFGEVKESPPGHDLEAPVHGSLGHCYIGFPLLAKAIAMRSVLCLELTLEFPKLKVFSDNSTLIRAISSLKKSSELSPTSVRSPLGLHQSVFFISPDQRTRLLIP
uniref:PGG domain-containing protein n=1 Tax=Brassica campestris TaxID=3711 RepID=M4DYC4_BRACM